MRAEALDGRTLGEIGDALGVAVGGDPVRTKGRIGQLLERALGATAGGAPHPDFPALGIELKTVPVGADGRPRESTFIASIPLDGAAQATWEASWVRRKLACVLWVPVETLPDVPPAARRIVGPSLWRPDADEERTLRADFDDLMGAIGAGAIERLTARDGVWLQVRPKAADGSVRTAAPDADGEPIETVPRGFYLRASATAAILAAARARRAAPAR